jgi:hypothetical protein
MGGGNRQGQDAPPQPEPTHMSWWSQHAVSALGSTLMTL